jgi:hypothetical protein
MNERIHELGKQAGAETSKEVVYLNNIHEWQLVFEQKFAELIVAECIAKVSEWDMGIDDPVGATDNTSEVARDMVAEIKEHFGVEE